MIPPLNPAFAGSAKPTGSGGIAVNLKRVFLKEVIEKVSPPFEGGVVGND